MIIIVATFAQALSGQAPAIHIIGVLVVWRFIMGVGIGGDYPLSAVISSEFASTRIRGRLMTAVFAFQGWGNFRELQVRMLFFVRNSLHFFQWLHLSASSSWRLTRVPY
jgi:PHS family inorganic phosphate transporter-like MFS transporter